jgi:hypothetical protein
MALILLMPLLGVLIGGVPVVLFHRRFLTYGSWWRTSPQALLGTLALASSLVVPAIARPGVAIYGDFILYFMFIAVGFALLQPKEDEWMRRVSLIGLYLVVISVYVVFALMGILTITHLWITASRIGYPAFAFPAAFVLFVVGAALALTAVRMSIRRENILVESLANGALAVFGGFVFFAGKTFVASMFWSVLLAFVILALSDLFAAVWWVITGHRIED